MTVLHTIILGIVEGLTEFLPISSTAHMDIVRMLLGIQSSDFTKSFEIIIQLGAILAVVVLYARRVFSSWKYFRNLIIAFIPTGIIGFILYKIVKSYLLGNILIEASALLIGGIIIIWFESHQSKKKDQPKINPKPTVGEDLSTKDLVTLGVAQSLAVIPGVSRSAAVIISGRALGLGAVLITEFSFLLAVPTMLAASGYDMLKSGIHFSGSEWGTIALGFLVAFASALVVIRWFLAYIRSHSFEIFGWYRIALGIILLVALYYKVL
jgi:undecaprenyl-diphosphatase